MTARALVLVISLGMLAGADRTPAQQPACNDEHYARLDLWVGEWDVEDGNGHQVGTNRIEKGLDGCVVFEHWRGGGGGEGKSLFYFHPDEKRWKQVWTTSGGFVKEKAEQTDYSGPGIRFQGRVRYPQQGLLLDRTTLTPLEGGRVRQLIEVSSDDGKTWQATFDAVYVPKGKGDRGQ